VTGEVHTGFWWGKLRERNQLEDLGIDGRTTLRCIFKNGDGDMECIYLLRIGTGGRLL
jgi:hypothetical protein